MHNSITDAAPTLTQKDRNASDYVFVDDVDMTMVLIMIMIMNIFFCCIGIFINHCYQLSRPPHPPTPWHLRLRQ